MKKLILLSAFLSSAFFFSQGKLHLQNYTPNFIEYSLIKSNQGNPAGNCTPTLQSGPGLSVLNFSTSTSVAVEALYEINVNSSNTFNAAYPDTPLISQWVLNSNFASPNNLPASPVPPIFSNVTEWNLIKFGVKDQSGTAIGGYYSLGYFCGNPTPITSLDPSAVISGSFFTFGGDNWIVFF